MIAIDRSEVQGPPPLVGRFYHVRATPFGERELEYRLLVPVRYRPVAEIEKEEPKGVGQFLRIGRFVAEEGAATGATADSIDVGLATLGADVHLFDFFEWLREQHKLEVIGLDPVDLGGREAVDALASWRTRSGPSRITRFLLFRAGRSIARVACTAVADRYDRQADDFAVVLSTFKLAAGEAPLFCEPFSWFGPEGASIPLGFLAPAAWTVGERLDGPRGGRVVDVEGPWPEPSVLPDGSPRVRARAVVKAIDLDVIPDPDPGAILDSAVARLADDGLGRVALRARARARLTAPFEADNVEVELGAERDGTRLDVRIAVRRTKRAAYVVTATLPPREDRFSWMAARRAVDVLLLSLLRPSLSPDAGEAAPEPVEFPGLGEEDDDDVEGEEEGPAT